MKQYEIKYRMESGTTIVMFTGLHNATDIKATLKAALSRFKLDEIILI